MLRYLSVKCCVGRRKNRARVVNNHPALTKGTYVKGVMIMKKRLTERDMQALKELERFRITEEEFENNLVRAKREVKVEQSNMVESSRKARCMYCGRITTSTPVLPFFESKPDKEFDEWYDGCRGWD